MFDSIRVPKLETSASKSIHLSIDDELTMQADYEAAPTKERDSYLQKLFKQKIIEQVYKLKKGVWPSIS